MATFHAPIFRRSVALGLVVCLVCVFTGCAAMFDGNSQRVTVVTTPPGRSVFYRGLKVSDGEVIRVRKRFGTPQFNVGESKRPLMEDMEYFPHAWLIGDAALLLLGIIPGLIAGGIDFGTGAWRNLDDVQHVIVPDR